MEQKKPTDSEQEEKLLDSLAQALILIAKQLSQQEIEKKQN